MNEVLALSVINWLVTLVLVESFLFKWWRDWLREREARNTVWYHFAYLWRCQLCTGVWVGFLLAALYPSVRPLGNGFLGLIMAGLLIRGFGHAILEVTGAFRRYGS